MFKTNLDFANLCLYNELDEIPCCFIFCDVWELFLCQHEAWKNMCCICRLEEEAFWATSWQNQQNDFRAQRRLRSAWASAQSDQSLCCARNGTQFCFRRTALTLIRLGGCPGWPSLRWAHRSFCWFCHAVAQFSYWNHFRNHCVWHCNEFANAYLTWCKRCSQTTPRWPHD